MLPTWVDAVWEASLKGNVHCDDEQFNQFRIPPFQNLNICSSGLVDKRDEIERLVNKYGGKFTGEMRLNVTDILICW